MPSEASCWPCAVAISLMLTTLRKNPWSRPTWQSTLYRQRQVQVLALQDRPQHVSQPHGGAETIRFHRSRRNRCDPGIRRPQFRASATLSRALHPTPERALRHHALLPQRLLHQGNRGHNRGQCRCRQKAIIPGPGQTQTTHQAMTKDKELENLFATAIQEFNDNDLFTADLSSKLDKVEILKHIQQEQKRRSNTRLLVAFFAGALSVIVALLLLPMLPTDMEIIRNLTSLSDIAFFSHKVKVLSSIILFVLTYSVVFSAYSIYSTLSADKTGKPSKYL